MPIGVAGITGSRKETQHQRNATSSGGCHLRPLHPHAHWQILEKPRQRSLRANESYASLLRAATQDPNRQARMRITFKARAYRSQSRAENTEWTSVDVSSPGKPSGAPF